jgi:hypothetical protein
VSSIAPSLSLSITPVPQHYLLYRRVARPGARRGQEAKRLLSQAHPPRGDTDDGRDDEGQEGHLVASAERHDVAKGQGAERGRR